MRWAAVSGIVTGGGRGGVALGEKHRGDGLTAGGQKGIYLQYPNRRHY